MSGSWASVSGADELDGSPFAGSGLVNRHSSTEAAGGSGRAGTRLGPLNRSPSRGCDERFGDRGAATVWAAGAVAVVMVVLAMLLWFVAAVVARHQAQSAADLAALAAASRADAGEAQACAYARWVAERMGVELRSCRLSGWDALVEVVAVPVGVPGDVGEALAKARAGPVERGS
jgi:secretion/DNA translocation related TadE-like protein